MGYLYRGTCFPDLATAKVEQCANAGSVWGSTTSAYTIECTSVGASSLNMCRRLNGGTCTNYTQPFEAYQSCTYDGGTTLALDYFGALLSVLVIVAVASKLKNYFWRNHESI